MVFKKLSKKIMAYTLTTAMALGFFAVSDINLTTAWADATDIATYATSADLTVDGETVDGLSLSDNKNDLNQNVVVNASCTLTITDTKAFTIYTGKVLKIKNGVTLTVKQGTTTKYTITGPTEADTYFSIGAGSIISQNGISTGAFTGKGTITGATIAGNNTFDNDTTLKNCKSSGDTTFTPANGKTLKIEGTFVGSSSSNNATFKTDNGGADNTCNINFENAVLSGNIESNRGGSTVTHYPKFIGSAKANGINLSGTVESNSTAVITINDENNTINCGAGSNTLNALTIKLASSYSDTLSITSSVASGTVSLINVLDADKFVDLFKARKLEVSGDSGFGATQGAYGFIKNNKITFGKLPFTYDKSGQKVTVKCVAPGCKYDGTTFDVTVKDTVGYAKRIENNKDIALVLSEQAKKIKDREPSLWQSFAASTSIGANAGVGTESSVSFGSGDASCHFVIGKRDISNAVVNGLSKYGITSLTSVASGATAHAVDATKVPDGFVSIELGDASITETEASGGGFTATGAVDAGTKTSFVKGAGQVPAAVVYKTEEGNLVVADITNVCVSNTLSNSTTGEKTATLVGNGTSFTGSCSVTYKIVDATGSFASRYTGQEQSAVISSASYYSTNGGSTWTEEAPKFTNAGDYEVLYKESENGEAKVAVCTLEPAIVTPAWDGGINYSYTGEAITRKLTGVSANNPSNLTGNVLGQFNVNDVTYNYYNSDGLKVASCVNVGNYSVKAILGNSNKNFKLSEPAVNINIGESEAVVTAKDATAYCDGKAHSIDKVTINAPEGSYKVTYGTTAGSCELTTPPSYTEEGTYKIYYKVAEDATYHGDDGDNVTYGEALTNGRSYVTLTIKPALTVKRSDSTAATVTYTGKYFPITADAYCGTAKESDVKVNIYASKNSGAYTKISDGIKDVGTYRFAYTLVVDGKEGSKVLMDDTVTIKAAAKKNLKNATASAKAVTYNANKQTAKVTVKYGKTTLKLGTDYTLKNATHINAGSFKVTITGKGKYTGTKTVTFKIAKRKVTAKVLTIKRSKKTYTVYVKIGKKNYKAAKTNYKLTSKYNKKTKKYAVTVAFKVNYSGTVKKTVK